MNLELTKELININQTVGENISQTLVEGDIIVPDIKPDILRILQVDGQSMINSYEIQQDKIIVNGTVGFKILYIPDVSDEAIKSINVNSNFIHQIEMNMEYDDIKAQVQSDIEHIEFKMINGRKINVKAIVAVDCKAINTKTLEMVTDISNNDTDNESDIQIRRENIRAHNIVTEKEEQFIVREDMEIPAGKPAIKDLLKVDMRVTEKDTRVINDKIVVKGSLNVCTLYIGEMDDNAIHFMEHEVLFTEVLDMDGAEEDMHCELDCSIQDIYYDIKEDLDGDFRVLEVEVTLNSYAKVSHEVSLNIVKDSYSTSFDIEMEKQVYNIDQIIADRETQTTVKEIISLPADIPDVIQVYNVITKPYIIDAVVQNNKIVIDGVIDTYILYLADSEENPVYSYKEELPFRHEVDIEGITPDMNCDIKLEVNHYSYSISTASEIEVRCVVNIDSRVIKTVDVEAITAADIATSAIQEGKKRPSIVIYFIQREDTLWEIAKRYRTTVQDIVDANNIEDPDVLDIGQQLIIPRVKKAVNV